MSKKLIIVGVVLVVGIGAAAFALLGQQNPTEDDYTTTPTQWSKEGDYKIEETPEGTVVTNTKAGFSFKDFFHFFF